MTCSQLFLPLCKVQRFGFVNKRELALFQVQPLESSIELQHGPVLLSAP